MRQINRRYPAITSALCDVWAIQEHKLRAMMELMGLRSAGLAYDAGEIQARIGDRKPALREVRGNVAVLPLMGVIGQRMNMLMEASGGTSTEMFGAALDAAVADSSIGAIVLNVDSPGGSVYGVHELSQRIYQARGKKPIVAVANSVMASAAYWIASAADQIAVTPSGDVGSIGVVAVHCETSKADAESGVRYTIIKAGKFKAEGNPYEPLGEEALSAIQRRVDETYDQFVADVARNRGTQPTAVRGGYGQGRAVGAEEAVKLGLADRVATLDEVAGKLAGTKPAAGRRASIEDLRRRAAMVPR